jgi:superfamily II DNA or RNA helicase
MGDTGKLREKNRLEDLCDIRFFFDSEDHRRLWQTSYVKRQKHDMGLLTVEVGSGKTITKNF